MPRKTKVSLRSNFAERFGRVIVVSHEASRTGAPQVAGDVLRALADIAEETVLIHRWGGPRKADLDAVADRSVFEPFRRSRVILRRFRATRSLAVKLEQFAAQLLLRRYRPELVWCNTTLSACYVKPCRRLGIPVVLHVHELGDLIH